MVKNDFSNLNSDSKIELKNNNFMINKNTDKVK